MTETGDDATPPPAPDDETDLVSAPPTEAESVEDYYARIAAAAGEDGRLPVAAPEMPGWDIYPYELDGLRLKPVLTAGRRGARAAGRAGVRLPLRPRLRRCGRVRCLDQPALAADALT